MLLFMLPWILFSVYQLLWASPRFESQAQVIVKQPDAAATLDPAMALLSGFGVASGGSDTQVVMVYIHSNDMLNYLENELNLRAHFSSYSVDFFSRLHKWNEQEEFLEYYKQHVGVLASSESGIITIQVQAFEQEYALRLNQAIVQRAEWFINNIGHMLAKEQLAFARNEHALTEQKLHVAQTDLLNFQERYNLLDPTAEGAALQQITYGIESQLSVKHAELKALKSVMSDTAPAVMAAQAEIDALTEQLKLERQRLSPNQMIDMTRVGSSSAKQLSVGEILAGYSDLKVAMELALQAYTSSLISLEKSRIEAYRKLQYLVTIESPTLPEDARYPERLYNIILFAVLGLLLFGIVRIVVATIKELTT
ncbi:hypothetical protein K0504_06915 [Neiella marina]|uniref:Uncharacterized protein n=2 Tax=Neiella holothuriorum TaxID=2870530 RepID=A0ABS7EEV0_9GAMM|nr:hypothetical protein [Neiella holothuriorum]